jgi:hypothetical protein
MRSRAGAWVQAFPFLDKIISRNDYKAGRFSVHFRAEFNKQSKILLKNNKLYRCLENFVLNF